jgi:hypothetical protein
MMDVTAKEILKAIRSKYHAAAIIREVSIVDEIEMNNRARDHLNTFGPKWSNRLINNHKSFYPNMPDELPKGWVKDDHAMIRRIDALMFLGNDITAIEIKVSLSDYKRETDEKRRAWRSHSDKFVYAAPIGLIDPAMLPPGCGLWEYDKEANYGGGSYGLTSTKAARRNKNRLDLPDKTIKNFFYRLSAYEAKD